MARDLLENGGNGRKIELDVNRRVDLEGAELEEYMRTEGEKHSAIKLIKRDVEEPSSDSDDDLEMNVITGKHDIVVRPEGRAHTGFFKSSRKQYAMFPFHEEKVRVDDYGEIIQLDDYKLADVGFDNQTTHDDNKENGPNIKMEDGNEPNKSSDNGNYNIIMQESITLQANIILYVLSSSSGISLLETPTKCISSRKIIDVNAQVQFIDFEGRSDSESLYKILSQLRPRRVVVVRGTPENTNLIAKHCSGSIGARVFTPNKGDCVDATTENYIYQVKLTEALVTQLQFQKVKDAEVSWIDAKVRVRNKKIEPAMNGESNASSLAANGNKNGTTAMEVDDEDDNDDDQPIIGPSTRKLFENLFLEVEQV